MFFFPQNIVKNKITNEIFFCSSSSKISPFFINHNELNDLENNEDIWEKVKVDTKKFKEIFVITEKFLPLFCSIETCKENLEFSNPNNHLSSEKEYRERKIINLKIRLSKFEEEYRFFEEELQKHFETLK